jgi:hypothetical protein
MFFSPPPLKYIIEAPLMAFRIRNYCLMGRESLKKLELARKNRIFF